MAEGESMWKLMGGLLALPVLLVLSVLMIFWGSGDYVRTVQLNWELELPASEGCLYAGQVRRSASDRNPGSAGRSGGPAARFFGLPRLHGGAPNG